MILVQILHLNVAEINAAKFPTIDLPVFAKVVLWLMNEGRLHALQKLANVPETINVLQIVPVLKMFVKILAPLLNNHLVLLKKDVMS